MYGLELFQIENQGKPIPTKFEYFRQAGGASNLKQVAGERLNVAIKLISNEFTHNTYINNLLLTKDKDFESSEVEYILKNLKNLKGGNELIQFHDKILDKLFQLSAANFKQEPESPVNDTIFETIIQMIDLFESRYQDVKEILDNYIMKHFAHSKVYKPLLAQIERMSLKIKEGLKESQQNEEANGYVLMTMKYLGIILKIVRNSFLEALSCRDESAFEDQSTKQASEAGYFNA